MKKIIYIVLLFTGIVNGQIVNIPDTNFKTALLSASATNPIAFISGIGATSVDTNNDGEIQVSEAAAIHSLHFASFPGSNIQDFTGINSFTNLTAFESAFNAASINIDGLIYLQNITFRNNNNNSSSVFNNLPALYFLDYSSTTANSITITNCPNIQTFYAEQNSNLTTLSLGAIPALKKLWAWSCNLSTLSIPNSPLLEELELYSNFTMSSISIGNSPLLKTLKLTGNNITSVAGFVNNLSNIQTLQLSGNEISNLILPLSMPFLQSISFNGTSSNNLNFGNYPNLNSIVIIEGNMVNIDVSNVPNLYQFIVHGNLITSIDISNNPLMNNFAVFDNPNLTSLNLKNGTNELNLNFSGIPNVTHICCDSGQLAQVQNIANQDNMTNTVINSYCTFIPGGNYNTITGLIRFDGNNNGCDVSDAVQPNIKININDGTNQGATFTNNTGNYTFYTQAGSFTLTPNTENPSWFTFVPPTATIPFANTNNNTTTQNFCISANGVHNDVEVVIAPVTTARPGFDATYKIVYKNKGNQSLSGSLTMTYNDSVLDFVSATTIPSAQSTGSLSWNYINLLPFENRSFYVTLNVNSSQETPAVNIGDVLNYTVAITPMVGDENPLDNQFAFHQTVVGSFDPNNIICMEGNVVPPSEIGKYLHYVINFENTGTFEAENIVVRTDIDPTKFDINSLQMLNTSHNAYVRQTGNTIEFIFESIALETGGHGNVLLKMKSKSNLVTGDMVSNRAGIYFDYNAPVDTGLANTTFQALSNSVFEIDDSILVYPNPTASIINIKSNFNIKSIQLYDVQGRLLQTTMENTTNTIIDISQKSNGVYFLKITTDKGSKVEKIIKG